MKIKLAPKEREFFDELQNSKYRSINDLCTLTECSPMAANNHINMLRRKLTGKYAIVRESVYRLVEIKKTGSVE